MSLTNLITLLGSLGIFIFGIKIMSESLSKTAGDNLKNMLNYVSTNRFAGIFTGLAITTIIQSSSATTVMVVGFVNAGLLNLAQSVGIIMGANIGTTITAWIVNLTKAKFPILEISYISVVVGLIFLFINNKKINNWGNVLLGASFLFIGLKLMEHSIERKTITENQAIFTFLQSFPRDKFWTYLVFVGIGSIITMIMQSSSATMAFTITLAGQNYINIEHAIAMVLGENIGTTITANLASLAGNKMAKKAALAHTLFNIFGVLWVLPLLKIIPHFFDILNIAGSQTYNGIKLALFHSMFNITNTFVLIWFVPQFVKVINFIYGEEVEKKRPLSNISFGIIKTPDISLLEAEYEVIDMAHMSYKMFEKTKVLINDSKKYKPYKKIKELELDMDDYEEEIYSFLVNLLKEDTSAESTDEINYLLDKIRNLEWIGDSCEMIADLIDKANDKNYNLNLNKDENLNKILNNIDNFFKLFIANIINLNNKKIIEEGLKFESKINELYKKLKKKSISDMGNFKKNLKKNVASGLLYMDIIKELEHIGDALKNIINIYNEKNVNLKIYKNGKN